MKHWRRRKLIRALHEMYLNNVKDQMTYTQCERLKAQLGLTAPIITKSHEAEDDTTGEMLHQLPLF